MVAPTMDIEGDLAMLFGDDDDSGDDDSDRPEDDKEVWEVGGPSTVAVEGHSLTLLSLGVPMPLSVIEDLCTRMGNLEYSRGQLVKKVIMMSDAKVADGIAIGEIGPRVSTVEGQLVKKVIMMSDAKVADGIAIGEIGPRVSTAVGRLKQVGTRMEQDQQDTTHRDEMIFGLSQHVQIIQAAVPHRDVQIQ
nr:hypothetical protein [Tanacetum cinerariifolium]